ncbi:hypothetical protein SAMN05428975_1189 [Mucilaginibacter sp. OK268]|uniref:hypothetical protein n=1 Tax=Mucilaginibacter sp. OK268 TaxID=1881048 RepID=UPI000887E3D3|nr:hypothetical protein [Mucilaginibacter sp. OK268]SDP33411.1 hypothetical protein SAMN05428975_1189 [Mucilaginibacter sp. OK268]
MATPSAHDADRCARRPSLRVTLINGVIARYEAISMLYRENRHGRPVYVEIASYLAMTREEKEPPLSSAIKKLTIKLIKNAIFANYLKYRL